MFCDRDLQIVVWLSNNFSIYVVFLLVLIYLLCHFPTKRPTTPSCLALRASLYCQNSSLGTYCMKFHQYTEKKTHKQTRTAHKGFVFWKKMPSYRLQHTVKNKM